MDNHVFFDGPGPFHLPPAQRASATGHTNNGVTLTVYCLAAKRVQGMAVNRGSDPEPISVQMVSSVARKLAADLIRAANEADAKGA